MDIVKVQKLNPNAILPQRATPGSAGYDLCACISENVIIPAGGSVVIPTGLAIALEENTVAKIYGRSGLGIRHGITLSNCVGIIDSDYRGEIMVGLINRSKNNYTIHPAERIAQMIIEPILTPILQECDSLSQTQRGAGGFGSTGN